MKQQLRLTILDTVRAMGIPMGILVLIVSQHANAVPVLIIDDMSTAGFDVILSDQQLKDFVTDSGLTTTHADQSMGIAGDVYYDGAAGTFDVVVTRGRTKPVIGTAHQDAMSLNNIALSGGIGEVQILFTDTDFLGGTSGVGSLLTSSISGYSLGTAIFKQYLDLSNQEFGMDPTTGVSIDHGSWGTGFTNFSDTQTLNVIPNGPFSITEFISVTHTATNQDTSVNFTSTVPEPGTLALLGVGLAAFGFNSRRKKT